VIDAEPASALQRSICTRLSAMLASPASSVMSAESRPRTAEAALAKARRAQVVDLAEVDQ